MPKNHRKQHKNGGKHTTLIDPAKELRDFLKKQPEVTSIVPGRIDTGLGNGRQGIKLKEINRELLSASVRGGASVQEVHIHTRSIKKTTAAIEANFTVK